jgi:hypothetical protein
LYYGILEEKSRKEDSRKKSTKAWSFSPNI